MILCKTAWLLAMTMTLRADDGRPTANEFVDDDITGARCHMQSSDQIDHCEALFSALVDARAAQHDEWGWPLPPSDNGVGGTDGLDIYLSTDAAWGAYVDSDYVDAVPNDGRMTSASFMVVDPRISVDEMHAYMAHEYAHVLQFGVDMSEPSLLFWEATSVRAEEVTYPGTGSGPSVAPDFQNTPWVGLLSDSYMLWDDFEIWSYYEYGAVLWLDILREEYGLTALAIWEAMVNEGWANEPDFLAAIDQLSGDGRQAFLDFSMLRARIGTHRAPEWAAAYQEAPVRVTNKLTSPNDSAVVFPKNPFDTGSVYLSVETHRPVTLVIEGDPAVDWGIVLVGDGTTHTETTSVRIESTQVVGLVNFGPPGVKSGDTPLQREVTAWLEAIPYEEPPKDTADPNPTDPPGGCNAIATRSAPWALLLLGPLWATGRRRQRA